MRGSARERSPFSSRRTTAVAVNSFVPEKR
jgi:hypothetical protein